MPLKYFLSFLFACLCFQNTSWAQFSDKPPVKSTLENDSSKIDIINIDKFKERTTPKGLFRELTGNVHLKQKEMHIWCDTGFIYPMQQVEAFSNVQMLQDDSIRIFSDSLYYDGIQRLSELRQNVVLKDTSMTLFTDKLDYDLNTRIATFPEGSLIESDSTTLISKQGTYNANTNMAHFSDSVRITNPNYKLTADSLAFNTQTEMAYFIGPTKVYNEEKMVYCEDGFYDSKKNYAELYKNARFENREDGKLEIAKGDTIIYDGAEDIYYLIGNAYFQNEDQEVFADTILMDGKTEQYTFRGNPKFKSRDTTSNQSIIAKNSDYDAINKTMIFRGDVRVAQDNQIITTDSLDYNTETKSGIAKGNVVWQDTSANLKITCGQAFYNDSTKYLLAHLNPILTTLIDNDTMWLRADTLISLPDSVDTEQRHLYAFHHVKTFKSNLQSLCDSLYYDAIDSTFYFYQDPILWVDGTQFTADTIHVEMRASKLYQVRLFEKSLIVNTNEGTFFNQIKGKDAIIQFKNGEVKTMDVKENGETVYYAVDGEGAYMLVNDIDCSSMVLFFAEKQIRRIRYEGKPKAVVYPMHQVNHNSLYLTGFKWLDSLQIKTKYEFLGIPEPVFLDSVLIDSTNLDSMSLDRMSLDSMISTSDSLALPILDSTSINNIDSLSTNKSNKLERINTVNNKNRKGTSSKVSKLPSKATDPKSKKNKSKNPKSKKKKVRSKKQTTNEG
jgi:lipopolysaccharide export system protein LptA